jgi:hypothetical protein
MQHLVLRGHLAAVQLQHPCLQNQQQQQQQQQQMVPAAPWMRR